MHMNLLVSLPLLVLLQGTLPSAPTTHPSVAAHGAPSTLPPQNQTPEHLNTQHLNTEYRIPYRLDETQHLAVRAKLNGRGPYNFIVDTGAPAVFIAKDVAARCGVKTDPDGWGAISHMEIEGGAVVEQVQARIEEPFQLTGMNALGLAAEHIDGVLGYNVLARFRFQVDMTQSKMLWTPSGLLPDIPINIGKLTGEEKARMQAAGKSQNQLEGLAKMATALLAHPDTPQTVRRGFFGIELEDTAQGPRIRAVLPDSPAAQSGLAEGDLILKLVPPHADPVVTRDYADVLRLTANVASGQNTVFVLQRGSQRLKRTVTAGKDGL